MESDERARLIEYLLKQEFRGHGWSKWLLTHPSPGVPTSDVAQRRRAENGVEAEIASRRVALEALPTSELRQRYQDEHMRELEAELDDARKEIKQLKQENARLRVMESVGATEKPLATRARRTLLCIIGVLAKSQQFDVSEPYKAGVVLEKALDELGVKVGHRSIGDYLNEVPEAMDSRRT